VLAAIVGLLVPWSPGTVAATGSEAISRQLGIALTLPPGWKVLPRATDAPVGLTLGRPNGHRPVPVRLTVGILGKTSLKDVRRAAQVFADRQVAQLNGVTIRRHAVRYAGTPGVMLQGMPGSEPTVQIILAHGGVVYRFTATGRALAPDQNAAMKSLRFIPMT
jgi:hypothetical protein